MAQAPEQASASPERAPRHPDLLAAVVLHALVSAGERTLSLPQTMAACERDPRNDAERAEIEAALEGLIADGLAYRRADGRLGASRAARRADSLSF